MEPRQREAWLDYVRMMSIFLVVLYHTPPRLPLLDEAVVLNLRMPVFFCVSGFLFNEVKYRRFGTFIGQRARQILVPYLVFCLAFYLLWLIVPHGTGTAWWQPLVEVAQGFPVTLCQPFWYITALFSMQIIYYVILRLTGEQKGVTMAACFALTGFYIALGYLIPDDVSLGRYLSFWRIEDALLFLPFYAVGNGFREAIKRWSWGNVPFTVVTVVLALISMIIMGNVYWMRDNTEQLWAGMFLALRIVAGLMVIPAYLCLGKLVAAWMGRHRAVELIVMSGTVYLALQNYCIAAASRLMNFAGMGSPAWSKPLVALAVMVIIFPVAWLIMRYVPWVAGQRKTQRP